MTTTVDHDTDQSNQTDQVDQTEAAAEHDPATCGWCAALGGALCVAAKPQSAFPRGGSTSEQPAAAADPVEGLRATMSFAIDLIREGRPGTADAVLHAALHGGETPRPPDVPERT